MKLFSRENNIVPYIKLFRTKKGHPKAFSSVTFTTPMPRLTKDSEAVKKLISWFKSGKLTATDKLKDVYHSHDFSNPTSYPHSGLVAMTSAKNTVVLKVSYFTYIYRSCSDYVIFLGPTDDDDDEELDRCCSYMDCNNKKRKLIDSEAVFDGDEESEEIGAASGSELVSGDLFFKPLHLLPVWKEPGTTTKCITAAIVLPSGIRTGDFSLHVTDSGEYLELAVFWPPPLLHMEIMHKKWLLDKEGGFKMYHPKILGFEQGIRDLRSKTSEAVQSVARISLPFRVQSRIETKLNLAWKDYSVLMLYVDLKAVVENYAITKDSEAFEVL